jgi:hypothetical protein
MNTLWTPENLPPQLSETATVEFQTLLQHDVAPVLNRAFVELEEENEPFATFLDEFGFNLNQASSEGIWPERALKTGAAVTLLAYRQEGITNAVDERAIELGRFVAELHGVPTTYLERALEDSQLQKLTTALSKNPLYDESKLIPENQGGYLQVLELGSGCARHYLQQAIQLAA